jgi:enhancing lycopene biosynthesis protein 2
MMSLMKGVGFPRYFEHLHKLGAFNTLRGLQTTSVVQAKVAVILSGCGVYDGSEIHEASACLVHLSRGKAEVEMFAPDTNQLHVIDHAKGTPAVAEARNVLVESARIARGKIKPLSLLNVEHFDAVVFPGGFGAAKNLSTFAIEGPNMKVNKEIENILVSFHSAKKPIGLCCIAPVLAAHVIKGCEVTIGSDISTAKVIHELGSRHVSKQVTESHIDTRNRIVTTPAFMIEAPLYQIFDGIGTMIAAVLKLTGKP